MSKESAFECATDLNNELPHCSSTIIIGLSGSTMPQFNDNNTKIKNMIFFIFLFQTKQNIDRTIQSDPLFQAIKYSFLCALFDTLFQSFSHLDVITQQILLFFIHQAIASNSSAVNLPSSVASFSSGLHERYWGYVCELLSP
jgi:hypothetical protein